jgi:pimeloyl-ACP methyl ester carboxylesterase
MICDVGDLHFSYETRGKGVPVLMIHGFGIDRHVMLGCMEPIFRRRSGWKRIYFDLPGMGQTPAPASLNNADEMLEAVIEFSNKVIPDESFLVAAESYGGYLARGMVRFIPERLKGVLLICPVIVAKRRRRNLPPREIFKRDEPFLQTIEKNEYESLFERVLVVQDERRWIRFTQDIIPGRRLRDQAFLERFEKHGYSFSSDVDLLERCFSRPTLMLVGRQDSSVGYRDALKIIENYSRGTFVILDKAGHGLEVEQETVFNCLVNEWLNRVEEEPAAN